jgi:MarR family transcriptional regulator, lower aerobic nicotinate degradation pathway regulator
MGVNARKRFAMPPPEEGEPLAYPAALLRLPSAEMFLLVREALRISQERSAAATDPGERMRFPHAAVLAALDEFGPASQRAISRRLRIDPSDLVAFVDWLEDAGFVERTRDDADRRRYRVELTPAGRRALGVRLRAAGRMNDALLAALGEGDRERLLDLLRTAVAGFGIEPARD